MNNVKHDIRSKLTELVMILDRSGSMGGLESDTIGGYNSFFQKQKETEGRALVSTVLFDDVSEVLYDRIPLEEAPQMTDRDYQVRGCTALLDALGSAIHHIRKLQKALPEDERPDKTIFVITTDGLENASRTYTYDKVKRMVENRKEKNGWEFIFLGANIDAVEVAGRMGITEDRAVNFVNDAQGTALNYQVLSEAVSEMRCLEVPLGADWKDEIDADYELRAEKTE